MATLSGWSVDHDWQARIDRAKQIDDLEREARRQAVLSSGFALQYERIAALQRLADLLEGEVYEEEKRWLPDVKQIGAGEFADRVDIVRFNAGLIDQFRRTLDDVAAEMGERVKGLEVRGGLKLATVTSEEIAEAYKEAKDWEKERFGDLDDDGQ